MGLIYLFNHVMESAVIPNINTEVIICDDKKEHVGLCSRRMRWAGNVARMGEERGVYRVLVGKPEGRRPLGRPRRRWVGSGRMHLQEVG